VTQTLIAASLVAIQSIKHKWVLAQTCRLADLSVGLSIYVSVCLSVRRVYCGKTADCSWMPFGVVSGVGRRMGVLDRGGDRRRGRTFLELNVGHATVTNGDFVTLLLSALSSEDADLLKLLWICCCQR